MGHIVWKLGARKQGGYIKAIWCISDKIEHESSKNDCSSPAAMTNRCFAGWMLKDRSCRLKSIKVLMEHNMMLFVVCVQIHSQKLLAWNLVKKIHTPCVFNVSSVFHNSSNTGRLVKLGPLLNTSRYKLQLVKLLRNINWDNYFHILKSQQNLVYPLCL